MLDWRDSIKIGVASVRQISFLHCGDVHLGHLQYNEPQRLEDFAEAFRQVVDFALLKRVDFILISGDFFHKRAINAQVLEQAIGLLTPLKEANIPVVVIEGNHDKAFYQDKGSWLGFLNNQGYLCLLTSQYEDGQLVLLPWDASSRTGSWVELPGVRIYGVGYLGVTTSARLTEAVNYVEDKQTQSKEANYIIFMLHAAINRLLGQDLGGVKKEVLEPFRTKVDYFALGHIHSRYEIDGWVYNSGSLECVHLDEYGTELAKGFYHVLLREEKQEVNYIASCYRPVLILTVSLTGTLGPEEATERIFGKLQKNIVQPGAQVRIKLCGEVPYSMLSLDTNMLTQRIKEEYNCLYVEILNQINLPADQNSLTGEAVKREDIERLVFGELLNSERTWNPGELEAVVSVVRNMKEMALAGEADEAIIEYLLKVTEESTLYGQSPSALDEGVSA